LEFDSSLATTEGESTEFLWWRVWVLSAGFGSVSAPSNGVAQAVGTESLELFFFEKENVEGDLGSIPEDRRPFRSEKDWDLGTSLNLGVEGRLLPFEVGESDVFAELGVVGGCCCNTCLSDAVLRKLLPAFFSRKLLEVLMSRKLLILFWKLMLKPLYRLRLWLLVLKTLSLYFLRF
jgi:hypothetical protein